LNGNIDTAVVVAVDVLAGVFGGCGGGGGCGDDDDDGDDFVADEAEESEGLEVEVTQQDTV
jgi:hypothetical protein